MHIPSTKNKIIIPDNSQGKSYVNDMYIEFVTIRTILSSF